MVEYDILDIPNITVQANDDQRWAKEMLTIELL